MSPQLGSMSIEVGQQEDWISRRRSRENCAKVQQVLTVLRAVQDMPALFWDGQGPPNFTPAEKAQWEGEMRAMIEWHVSFPCIIMWVVFNEGWGQYETERVVQFAQVGPWHPHPCHF